MTDPKTEDADKAGDVATLIGKLIGRGLAVATVYVVVLPFSVVNAWALTILYGWFVLPLFPGLPAISIAPMLGVLMFKGAMWHRPMPTKKDDSEKKVDWWAMAFNLLYGPISLIFAYPVHWWMT